MDGEELGLIEDSGDSGTSGVAEEDISAEETSTETAEETEAEGPSEEREGERESEEAERRTDRALPTHLRRAIREFVAGNQEFAQKYPRLERQLTAALFKAQQSDRMGGLQALRTASELLETHGGAQGIQEMAEEVEASRMMQEGIHQGDPVFIDVWSKESPEGFKAASRQILAKLESMDPVEFDRTISDPMIKTLVRCGVFDLMGDLKAAIAGERFEDIQKFYGQLETYFRNLQDYASRTKAPDPLKGQRDELESERQQFADERTKAWYGDVRSDVNNQMMAVINQLLRQELAGRKVPVETGNRIRKLINEDLATAVNTAPGYAERYKAVLQSRDHAKAVRFIVAAARQKAPAVIRRVLRDFNLSGGSRGLGSHRKAAASGGPHSGTGGVVAGRPKTADVDFSRTDKTAWLGSMTLGHGEAWLKNGKRAKW